MTKTVTLTRGQQQAFVKLLEFINTPTKRVFILNGYAGTGKTTLMKELIKQLQKMNARFFLLASTGRAAKILKDITGADAQTIHSLIYKYSDFNQDLEKVVVEREKSGIDKSGQLLLNFMLTAIDKKEDPRLCIYIIDESSMIADTKTMSTSQAVFGSGRLLNDLMSYDPQGKYIFVGDVCQLPPIEQTISPALSSEYFRQVYKTEADEATLTEIVRQREGNDIVLSAKRMRELYFQPPILKWGKFPFKGYKNIHLLSDQSSLISQYIKRIQKFGYKDTTLICRTNKTCDTLARTLRPTLGLHDKVLQKGDLLLVTQNNNISGLMNGDLIVIEQVSDHRIMRAGLTFLNVTFRELSTDKQYSQLLIEDVINSSKTNLTQDQQKELYLDFFMRMRKKGIKQKHPYFQTYMMSDIYLNALRAVFGFALTCHKAQGGEWDHVFLDIPRRMSLNPNRDTYQWIYTAMTRAKTQLYLVDDFYIV